MSKPDDSDHFCHLFSEWFKLNNYLLGLYPDSTDTLNSGFTDTLTDTDSKTKNEHLKYEVNDENIVTIPDSPLKDQSTKDTTTINKIP